MHQSDSYTPLHVHSDYSILDGKAKVAALADRAAELNLPALSITDHGSLGGAYELYRGCNRVGIKPIIGLEAYEAPNLRTNKSPTYWGTPDQKRDDVGGSGSYTHLTLFAKGSVGLRNLYRLYEDSWTVGHYYKPRVDTESLALYSNGLVATSGCVGGAISTLLRLNPEGRGWELAKAKLETYLRIFGPENFFIEVMRHDIPIERRTEDLLLRLSDEYRLRVVATLDSHYVLESDRESHDDLLCVQTGALKSTPPGERFAFEGNGYHLQSATEIRGHFVDLPSAVDNTLALSSLIGDYDDMFSQHLKLPVPRSPSNNGSTDLRRSLLPQQGYHQRSEEASRIAYEVDIITSRGFDGYILVVADLIKEARKRGIRIGPGRGSAAGSLVCYLLGITEVSPLEHGLIFERFINPERDGLPDIDIDVDQRRRQEFIELTRELYGTECVAQLVTYGSVGAKSALKDAVRIAGRSIFTGIDLVKLLPRAEFGRQPTLSEIGSYPTELSHIVDVAKGLEGSCRSQGIHAAGVIIGPSNLSDVLPIHSPGGKGHWVSSYTQAECEALGFLKTDFLGLATLGVIDECVRLLRRGFLATPESVVHPSLFELPRSFEDPATYELLSAGETTGVFQLDGSGMRSLLRKLHPGTLLDISAVLALYRPGPMGVNAHTGYADRKMGRSSVEYPHPTLEVPLSEILSPTYGLVVFQEQVLEILRVCGGYTYGTAALIFDAMRKKDREKLLSARPDFCQRLHDRGYSDDAITSLWDVLVPFADYSFNKSHATGYGIIAYWTAYLKRHHPQEFFCSLLTVEEDPEKLHEYIAESIRWGIKVLPPDINTSNFGWTLDGGAIRFGLGSIKGISKASYDSLERFRPYSSIDDLLDRVPKKTLNVKTVGLLAAVGAFDGLYQSREGLYSSVEGLVASAVAYRDRKVKSQTSLWKSYQIGTASKDLAWRRSQEESLLGVPLSTKRVTATLGRHLDYHESYWVVKAIQGYPGDIPLDLKFGLTELRSFGMVSQTGLDILGAMSPLSIEEN